MPPICAAPVAALRDSLQIKFIDGILVNAFVFEKHKHIDLYRLEKADTENN